MGDLADSSPRVLVVDDNADTALSLFWLLQSYGHDVRTATTGGEAIEAARHFRPDAVLLDLGLPDVDGFEVARRLRTLPGLDNALLVAATGYSRETDRVRAAAAGFDHYLVKPYDPRRIAELLATRREPTAVLT